CLPSEGLTEDDVRNLGHFDVQRFVTLFDGVTDGGGVVPSRVSSGTLTEIVNDFSIDFEVDLSRHNLRKLFLSVQRVLTTKVLLRFLRPNSLQLPRHCSDCFTLDGQV